MQDEEGSLFALGVRNMPVYMQQLHTLLVLLNEYLPVHFSVYNSLLEQFR